MSTLPVPPTQSHDRVPSYPWQPTPPPPRHTELRQPRTPYHTAPPHYANRGTVHNPAAYRDVRSAHADDLQRARTAIHRLQELAGDAVEYAHQALGGLNGTDAATAALEDRVKRLEADLAGKTAEATQLENELLYAQKALQGRDRELHEVKQQLQSMKNAVTQLDAERSEYEYAREAQRSARRSEERETQKERETSKSDDRELANMAAQRLVELLEDMMRNKKERQDSASAQSAPGSRPEVSSQYSEVGSERLGSSKSPGIGSGSKRASFSVFKSRSVRRHS